MAPLNPFSEMFNYMIVEILFDKILIRIPNQIPLNKRRSRLAPPRLVLVLKVYFFWLSGTETVAEETIALPQSSDALYVIV
jgi:hypothetical protein